MILCVQSVWVVVDRFHTDESELDILVVLLDGVNLQNIKINLRPVVENLDVLQLEIHTRTFM